MSLQSGAVRICAEDEEGTGSRDLQEVQTGAFKCSHPSVVRSQTKGTHGSDTESIQRMMILIKTGRSRCPS